MSLPPDDPPPGVPEWVVTYGDMMSLLLTFFIMLVSMSTMKDDGKMRMMMDAVKARFGSFIGDAGAPGESFQTLGSLDKLASDGSNSDGGIKRTALDAPGGGGPSRPVRRIGHQAVPTLGGVIRFAAFDASLTPEVEVEISRLCEVLRPLPNHIVVRGHATPQPIPPSSKYADAWDLSFHRASAVADRLEQAGMARDRLIVSAAGDTEPHLRGGVDVQDENRRVDVYVIESYTTHPDGG